MPDLRRPSAQVPNRRGLFGACSIGSAPFLGRVLSHECSSLQRIASKDRNFGGLSRNDPVNYCPTCRQALRYAVIKKIPLTHTPDLRERVKGIFITIDSPHPPAAWQKNVCSALYTSTFSQITQCKNLNSKRSLLCTFFPKRGDLHLLSNIYYCTSPKVTANLQTDSATYIKF
jgi:hypothetical protein